MGGYEAIKRVIEPPLIHFLPPEAPPPQPAPKIPDTVIDDIKVAIPDVIYSVKKMDTAQDRVTTTVIPERDDTQSAPTVPSTPVTPPPGQVEKESVRYAANFDPRYAHMIQPNYPGIARSMGAEGTVELVVTIGEDGLVKTVTLAKSSGYDELDTAALKHAQKHWRFKPATEDGKPVVSTVRRRIVFKLDIQRS
jgi:protein TonB